MEKPLSIDSVIEELETLNLPDRVAVGVSGGRDSMVLARACAWAAMRLGKNFIAITIDHGLRPGSAQEAEKVSVWCKQLGLPHFIYSWQHTEEITSRVQERARHARYALLLRAADEHQCEAILTAHTRSDLAETMMMRLARGTGSAGLVAMDAERHVALGAGKPVRLLRPMLSISRQAVTALAGEMGLSYLDDPSNDNPAYERIRYRALLTALEEQDLLGSKALMLSSKRLAREQAQMRNRYQQQFQEVGGVFLGWGGVCFDRERLELEDHTGMLARLFYAIGAGEYPADEQQVRTAVESAITTGTSTLAGVMIKKMQHRVFLFREPAALHGRKNGKPPDTSVIIRAGEARLWDHRFLIRNKRKDGKVCVMANPKRTMAVALFHGPKMAIESLPVLVPNVDSNKRKNTLDEENVRYLLPGRCPEGIDFSLLIEERFNANVIRYNELG